MNVLKTIKFCDSQYNIYNTVEDPWFSVVEIKTILYPGKKISTTRFTKKIDAKERKKIKLENQNVYRMYISYNAVKLILNNIENDSAKSLLQSINTALALETLNKKVLQAQNQQFISGDDEKIEKKQVSKRYNNITAFNNDNFGQVRTIILDDKLYFISNDLTAILKYKNGSRDVNRHVDEEDREKVIINGHENIVVNESGLYSLILSSKMPKAKQFKHWITSEVLPAIRKDGFYATKDIAQKIANDPDFLIELGQKIKRQNAKILELENTVNEIKPALEHYKKITDTSALVSIYQASKILNIQGYGSITIFDLLRRRHIISPNNIAYQQHINSGCFQVMQNIYKVNGDERIHCKTMVTQKGLEYLRRLIVKDIQEKFKKAA